MLVCQNTLAITKSSLKDLHILKQYHPELPLHPDTFLKSGASQCLFPTEIFPDGEFVYFRIKTNLLNPTDVRTIRQGNGNSIKLDINMNGSPIF